MLTDLNAVEIGEKTEKGLLKIRAEDSLVLVGGRGGEGRVQRSGESAQAHHTSRLGLEKDDA